MAYATVQQFVDAVTEAEATVLARAAAPATGYDAAQIQRALDDASAELDTYFAAKYPTPLNPVPEMAQQAAVALAREALDRQGRDTVKAAAARLRAWAKDVARGLAVLAGGVAGVDAPAPTPSQGVQVAAPARVFTDESLAAFTGRCS
jgi:phage gp36-like protein